MYVIRMGEAFFRPPLFCNAVIQKTYEEQQGRGRNRRTQITDEPIKRFHRREPSITHFEGRLRDRREILKKIV